MEFIVGRAVQGLATGMMLVAALPPLVTTHPADKLPLTAAVVNLGLFGMTTLGPLVGGVVGTVGGWRPLFVGVAVLGLAGFVMAVLGFQPSPAQGRGMGFDPTGVPLAAAAAVLPFIGVAWLAFGSFTSLGFVLPVAIGVLALVAVVVVQYRKRSPLMPVRLLAHTLPVSGIGTAMVAGAAFTALLELVLLYLSVVLGLAPIQVGALLATQLVGVVVAAWLFKRMITTRWLPVLAFGGLAVIGVADLLLLLALSPTTATWLVPVVGVLLGFGAGAGVAPALFMGGLSAPASRLGPAFAMVELLRSEAAFVVAPVLLQVATTARTLTGGIQTAIVATLVIVSVGGLAVVLVLLLGGRRPHAPDLETWLGGEEPAFDSPRFAAVLRS